MKIKTPVFGLDKHFYCTLGNIFKVSPFPLYPIVSRYHPQSCAVLIVDDKAIGSGSKGAEFGIGKNQKKYKKNTYTYK
jgi:hypothetical protein